MEKLDHRETFIKLVLLSALWGIIALVAYNWLSRPFAMALSYSITAIIAYFWLPAAKKLGFLKWAVLAAAMPAIGLGSSFAKQEFGEYRSWTGFVLIFTGLTLAFFDWIQIWLLADGEIDRDPDDAKAVGHWLVFRGVTGLLIVMLGLAFLLGLW